VSHLGEQISALVDGELTGAELDRANAHLATCERCRTEAAALRQLKRELRALGEIEGDNDLTRRLLGMAGPGGPVPSRRLRREQYARERGPDRPRDDRRPRYVLWSAVSLVVVGIGTAAFSMGGGSSGGPGPKITPQMEMFSVEHALTFGDVPFPDPTPTQVPAGATRP
jgi:anti-sigma factor RsiW